MTLLSPHQIARVLLAALLSACWVAPAGALPSPELRGQVPPPWKMDPSPMPGTGSPSAGAFRFFPLTHDRAPVGGRCGNAPETPATAFDCALSSPDATEGAVEAAFDERLSGLASAVGRAILLGGTGMASNALAGPREAEAQRRKQDEFLALLRVCDRDVKCNPIAEILRGRTWVRDGDGFRMLASAKDSLLLVASLVALFLGWRLWRLLGRRLRAIAALRARAGPSRPAPRPSPPPRPERSRSRRLGGSDALRRSRRPRSSSRG